MTVDHSPNLGELVPSKQYQDQNSRLIQIDTIKRLTVMLFFSMHCVRCIELISQIRSIHLPNTTIVIFSTGDQEDNKEIGCFLQKTWSIVSLSAEQMEEDFKVNTHPFCIVSDEDGRVLNKGNVYQVEDISNFVNAYESKGRFKKLFKFK